MGCRYYSLEVEVEGTAHIYNYSYYFPCDFYCSLSWTWRMTTEVKFHSLDDYLDRSNHQAVGVDAAAAVGNIVVAEPDDEAVVVVDNDVHYQYEDSVDDDDIL